MVKKIISIFLALCILVGTLSFNVFAEAIQVERAEETEENFIVDDTNSNTDEFIFYCDEEEHLHTDECFEIYKALTCENNDTSHEHSNECFTEYKFLVCDKTEHTHTDECLKEDYWNLAPDSDEEQDEAQEQFKELLKKAINKDGYLLNCEKEEHVHDKACFEPVQNLICEIPDHKHSEDCYEDYYMISCGKQEHTHTEECISEIDDIKEEVSDDSSHDNATTDDTPLKHVPKTPLKVTSSNDTYIEIRQLNVQVFNGGQWNGDKYVKTVTNNAIGQRFGFRVNFAVSGVGDIEPYTEDGEGVKITIPKQILRNRVGNLADTYEMSIPHISEINDEDIDADTNYCYYEEDDNIVIVNFRERPAGDNGYFEIAYATNQNSINYKDMGVSDDFFATIEVSNNEQVVNQESNHVPVYMDTTAKITSTNKRYPSKYDSWQSSWGEKPEDADDYFYLVWGIDSNINAIQPYNLTFTDETTSDYGVSEFVGYKFSGQTEYSTNNEIQNQTATDRRYDYVLTRHLKSDFEPLDYYKIENNVKITLTPADLLDAETQASSTRPYTYQYHVPVWSYPTGHFNVFKYADGSYRSGVGYNVLNEKRDTYSRYDLQDWKDSSLDVYDKFDWGVVMVGYPYPWTIAPGADIQDPASYGVTPVTFEVSDNTLFFGATNNRQLTYEDYEIDTLNYGYSKTKDATLSFTTNSQGDTSPSYKTFTPEFNKDTDVIYFYSELRNSGEYVLCATHNLRDGSIWFDSNYVVSVNPSTYNSNQIVFVDDITGYKVKYDSAYYYTNIELNLNAHLKHSDYVDTYCADKSVILFGNTASGEYFDNRNEEPSVVFSGDRTDYNYAAETIIDRDSWINKKVVSATNSVKKKQYTIGWTVDMFEKIKINDEPWKNVRQESGVFYDLLPAGAVLDTKSVAVKVNNSTYLNDNDYSISQIPNYKNSGRTLLIVDMPIEANTYSMSYDTVHHWDSIKDFGTNVYNPVAYETGNDSIYKGFNNDGGNLKDKELMSDLGNNGNSEPKFIYSDTRHNILALTSAVSGLSKKVKNETDKSYTYDTWTKNNGRYSYRLRYQNTFNTTAKNLIFFDSLENFVVDGDASDWKGMIESFDLSQLIAMGINPVVYVSETPSFDLEQYNISTNFDNVFALDEWVKLDDYEGELSEIKAYAIDCRENTDGTEFELEEGKSIQAVVYMKAPDSAEDVNGTGSDYPEVYNNIYLRNTITGLDGIPQDFYIHQDYTNVKFIVKKDVSLEKVSSEDSDIKIKDIKFRLTGTSKYGTDVDKIKSTDRNGKITFDDIEPGTYILQEYETTKNWLLDTTEHIVIVGSDATVTIDGQDYTDSYITLENNPRIYTDIMLLKRREGDSADDLELKQVLSDKNIGDTVEYNGEEYIVISKTDTKITIQKPTVFYAVQIYGIGVDDLSDDNGKTTYKAGLTFGPAVGGNYINSYKSHTPDGQTDGSMAKDEQAHEHRCIHDDDWKTIIYWNNLDPLVYEQCVKEGCTHRTELSLSDTLKNPNYINSCFGDGPGKLYNELLDSNVVWNKDFSSNTGWGGSRVRAMLNGKDSFTYYYNDAEAFTEDQALISSFPSELQSVIGHRVVNYDRDNGIRTTYDKLWLLSPYEITTSRFSSYYGNYKEASSGVYQKFKLGNSSFNAYGVGNIPTNYYWTRSRSANGRSGGYAVVANTTLQELTVTSKAAIAPAFSLERRLNSEPVFSTANRLQFNIEIKPQTPIANTTFKLSGTSDYGTDVVKILTSDENGKLVFDDIEIGTYELREIKPNDDYILNETVWTVRVLEDRSVVIEAKEDEKDRLYEVGKDETERYSVIYNEPRYWDFTLRKVDSSNTNIWLEGAEFNLRGISDLNTEYDVTITSDENGRVGFERIEKGTYILKETKAPIGLDENGRIGGNRSYLPDNKNYIVKIDEKGNVTIDGLSLNEFDDYEFKNNRALEGKITITKIWKDTDPSDRVAPVIHLSTKEPEATVKSKVTYDANGGSFDDSSTKNLVIYDGKVKENASHEISYQGNIIEGEVKEPSRSGYTFTGWFLDKGGTVPYNPDIFEGKNLTVYAGWEKLPSVRYAVQIYGIGVDDLSDDNGATIYKAGLTFGPAVGNYLSSYKSHIATGKTDGSMSKDTKPHYHRCIHNDDWETIIYWNNIDPQVYEQCILEDCTHSVELSLSDILKNSNFTPTCTGDGPGVLKDELSSISWNGRSTVDGGWGASRIRAMLNGVDSLTGYSASFSWSDINDYTQDNALISAFPVQLQAAIGNRAVKYDSNNTNKSEENLKISYDKLWLLSPNEMADSIDDQRYNHPLEAPNGKYQKFIEKDLNISSTTAGYFFFYSSLNSVRYNYKLANTYLRSTSTYFAYPVLCVDVYSKVSGTKADLSSGVSPCFSLSR